MYLKKSALAVRQEVGRDAGNRYEYLGAFMRLTLQCPVCSVVGVFTTEPSNIDSIREDRGHHYLELEESFECKHCGVESRLPTKDRKRALAVVTQAAANKLLKKHSKVKAA